MKRSHLLLLIFLASCSGVRTIPQGEKLYTGADVNVESSEKLRNKKAIKLKAEEVIRPLPNKKFLGNRPKVWIYNITSHNKGKGFKHWLNTKVGEPPVLMRDVKPETITKLIEAAMYNIGIFNSSVESKTEEKEKKGKYV